jgi:hypothetical protein
VAPPVSVHFRVVYDFGGYLSPKPAAELKPSADHITVRFRLALPDGTALPAATQAGLARHHDVRATLRGPDIKPEMAVCTWVARGHYLQCLITTPRHVRTGRRNRYTIKVTENLGGGFVTVPPDVQSQNPVPVYFG